MKKQIVIIGIIALLICVSLSGCQQTPLESDNKNELDRFLGSWILDKGWYNYTIVFSSDYKYQSNHIIWNSGSYDVNNGQLILSMDNSNMVYTINYSFSDNDQIFTLSYTNGDTLVFTKQ